jgi:PleD family two-component response regulator
VRLEREQQRTSVLLAQLERLSHEDPLTGLANRRRWDAELGSVCAAARQSGSVVAVVLLDIDHFKEINDRHGHPGGDEFAVLLPDADLDRAIELAERLRAEAAGLAPAGFGSDEVSLSLGSPRPAAYPLELISRADQQLYRAKITRNAVGAPPRELPVPS